MRPYALAACVALGGCAPAAGGIVVGAEACRSGPVALWLDFEGAGVAHGTSDDAAAMPVKSVLAATSAVIPPFDSSVSAPGVTRAEAIVAVVDRVRTLLQPFNVAITTARPAAAPYTRILVGGTPSALGVTASEAGLARLDCGNLTDGDVAYVFADDLGPDFGGVVGVANAAAHEAGHAFGLEHVTAAKDVMYAVAVPSLTLPDLFALSFGSGSYSSFGGAGRQCTSVDPVDEATALACNVGARAGGSDVTPPVLTWNPPTSDVATSFDVSAQASDETGVVRVEVYKNLELVASLATAPFVAHIDAAPGEHFYVTVEAIDGAANRTTRTSALTATAATMPGLDGGTPPPPDLATAQPMPVGHEGGCSIAPPVAPSADAGFGLLLFAVAALFARARIRATGRSSGSG